MSRAGPRIVSLIPSGTEIVAGLGMTQHLVGVSHECDYPAEVAGLPVLTAPKVNPEAHGEVIDREVRELLRAGLSVYTVDVARLQELSPDVIVTQDHCVVCAVTLSEVEDALCDVGMEGVELCSLHPGSLEEVFGDIRTVAGALGVADRGERLEDKMRQRFAELAVTPSPVARPSVALIEWIDPPMIAGGWMPEIARLAGGAPVIVTEAGAFAEVSWDDIARADPDLVVLLPCGFSIARTLEELEGGGEGSEGLMRIPAVRAGRCAVVDGNAYFNRPGPRLVRSTEILGRVIRSAGVPTEGRGSDPDVLWLAALEDGLAEASSTTGISGRGSALVPEG